MTNGKPSVGEFIVTMVVFAVVMTVGAKLLAMWAFRPIPYPAATEIGDRCVCRERARRSGMFGWAGPALVLGSFAVAYTVADWLALVTLATGAVLLTWSQRLYWQTRWAHRAGECCCPGRHDEAPI